MHFAPSTLSRSLRHCPRLTLSPAPPPLICSGCARPSPGRLGFPPPRSCPRSAPVLQRPLTSAARAPSLARAPLPWHAPASPPALRQGDARLTPPPAPPQAPGRAVAASSSPLSRPHFRAPTPAEPKSAAAAARRTTRSEQVSGVSMETSRRCKVALPAKVAGAGTTRQCRPRDGAGADPVLSICGSRPLACAAGRKKVRGKEGGGAVGSEDPGGSRQV